MTRDSHGIIASVRRWATVRMQATVGMRLSAWIANPPTPVHAGPLKVDARLKMSGKGPTELELGRYSYAQALPRVVRFPNEPRTPVIVGAFCSIGTNVMFFVGGNHRTDWVSTFPFRQMLLLEGWENDDCPYSNGPIIVGSDVWIGMDAVIMSGVTVGHGAVIGARAVVARDVRPYAVVVGNPAKEVRRRFSDETVEALLASAWWTWPSEEVLSIADLLNGVEIENFLAYAKERGERAKK